MLVTLAMYGNELLNFVIWLSDFLYANIDIA